MKSGLEDLRWLRAKVKTNTNTFPSADVDATLKRSRRTRVNKQERFLLACAGGDTEDGQESNRGNYVFPSGCWGRGLASSASGENWFSAFFPVATLVLFFSSSLEIAFCQAGPVVARSCGLCQEVAVLELDRLGRQVSMPNAYVCPCTAQVVSLGRGMRM